MRLRNNIITPTLQLKPIVKSNYERIDETNVRIGIKWFKFTKTLNYCGVTIYDGNTKRFIKNSWYEKRLKKFAQLND